MPPCVRCYVLPYSLLSAPVRQLYVARLRYSLLLQIWTYLKNTLLFFLFLVSVAQNLFFNGMARRFLNSGYFFDRVPCFLLSRLSVEAFSLTPSAKGWKCCLPTPLVITKHPRINQMYSSTPKMSGESTFTPRQTVLRQTPWQQKTGDTIEKSSLSENAWQYHWKHILCKRNKKNRVCVCSF